MTANAHPITSITTSNDVRVKCRFLDSPNFTESSNICKMLHWLFVLYCPDRTHSHAYLLRQAIEHFLDYRALHNQRNPQSLQVSKYTDINSEVFLGYVDYLRGKDVPLACAQGLRQAIASVAKENENFPPITLPQVEVAANGGTPPLEPDGFETLQNALITHSGLMRQKLTFRLQVDSVRPYTAEEVMDTVRPKATKENLIKWASYCIASKSRPRDSVYYNRFLISTDPEIRALPRNKDGIKQFHGIYDRDVHLFPCSSVENPFDTGGFANWPIDYARAVKTFVAHGFPFSLDLNKLNKTYTHTSLTVIPDDCDDIVKILLHRITTANRSSSKNRVLRIDELLSLYYPNIVDMTSTVMFLMLQSNWNKETVLALDKDNFEHALTSTLESNVRVIFSEKNRSQEPGIPFDVPKRMISASRDDEPFSTFNLIVLAQDLSTALEDYPFDHFPAHIKADRLNPLFLCIRPWAEWEKAGRHTSIAHPKTFRVGVQQFLKQYEVIDGGKRLTTAKELTRRLRPTWLQYKKKHNPIALLSSSLGHADRETTDIFYDNSTAAKYERLRRLRSELENIVALLRNRQFKGLIGKKAQADGSANTKIFHIPGKERALWGCADQKSPDWPGSEHLIGKGRKCSAIGQCIFCSQVRIFEDSLPYLMERLSHLEEFLGDQSDIGFQSRFEKELETIQYILDEWGDEDEIAMAARYRRYNSPLLPRDLAALEIIFESEDHNV